jgi:hypothetical protein
MLAGLQTYTSATIDDTTTTTIDESGTYMNGQRIATYEDMGIQSLLQKYKIIR